MGKFMMFGVELLCWSHRVEVAKMGWFGGLVTGKETVTIVNNGFRTHSPFLNSKPNFIQIGPK